MPATDPNLAVLVGVLVVNVWAVRRYSGPFRDILDDLDRVVPWPLSFVMTAHVRLVLPSEPQRPPVGPLADMRRVYDLPEERHWPVDEGER